MLFSDDSDLISLSLSLLSRKLRVLFGKRERSSLLLLKINHSSFSFFFFFFIFLLVLSS